MRPDRLRALVTHIFAHAHLPAEDAAYLADALVRADARGMHSHGVQRVTQYLRKITAGGIKAGVHGTVVSDRAAVVVLDGQDGVGQLLSRRAMEMAIGKARELGVGLALVRNSNHHGESGQYAMMAVDAGMIGIVTSNGSPSAPAWGATMPRVTGPWPLAIATPGSGDPVVLDMSLGVVSKGRIQDHANRKQKIPFGWGFDKAGVPTDDPRQVLDGGWSSFIGDYKGWGLLVMIELLTGVLAGGRIADEITDLFAGPPESSQGLSHLLLAIDVSSVQPVDTFTARVAGMAALLKASQLADGFTEIVLPGELEFRRAHEAEGKGIVLAASVARDLRQAALDAGCPAGLIQDALPEAAMHAAG